MSDVSVYCIFNCDLSSDSFIEIHSIYSTQRMFDQFSQPNLTSSNYFNWGMIMMELFPCVLHSCFLKFSSVKFKLYFKDTLMEI